MTSKTLAMVAYLTIIGWLVAYFQYKNSDEKSLLVRYHLEQALGIFIIAIGLGMAIGIVSSVVPALSGILSLVSLVPLILLVLGIITASNEACRPVPVVGKLFEQKFGFL